MVLGVSVRKHLGYLFVFVEILILAEAKQKSEIISGHKTSLSQTKDHENIPSLTQY